MSPDIMTKVAGCRLAALPATLLDYQRSLVKGEVYPGIAEKTGGIVEGVLYLDVPAEALKRLDAFEGGMYERREVTVREAGRVARAAMTYVFRPEYRDLLTGTPWDFNEFLVSGKKRFEDGYLGFDELDR